MRFSFLPESMGLATVIKLLHPFVLVLVLVLGLVLVLVLVIVVIEIFCLNVLHTLTKLAPHYKNYKPLLYVDPLWPHVHHASSS